MTEAGMGVTAALIEDGKRNECEFVGHIYSIFEFKVSFYLVYIAKLRIIVEFAIWYESSYYDTYHMPIMQF